MKSITLSLVCLLALAIAAPAFAQSGEGRAVPYTAGGSVSAGDLVQVGQLGLGYSSGAMTTGQTKTVWTVGTFDLDKAILSTDVTTVGGPVWFDLTGQTVKGVPATGLWFLGFANEAATSATATVEVTMSRFADEGPRYLAVSATPTTLAAADFMSKTLVVIQSTAGAATVNLPAVATVPTGAVLIVRKTGSAGAITLDPASTETIAGGATHTAIDAQNDFGIFLNTGAAWILVDSEIAS